jgi:anti-sigma28 factor (negative regulator of flagellin synthesis)
MKIPGSGSNDEAKRKAQAELNAEQSAVRRNAARGLETVAESREASQLTRPDTDSVKLSALGAFFREELDGTKMLEERRQKIAMLKEQINNGTYSPSPDAVARAVGEELSLEVVFGAGDDR